MTRTGRRLRLLRLTFACAALASGVAGCGGGTPALPGPAPSESAYLLAEFVAVDSNNQCVRVWDPAQPSVAVQNVKLVMSNGIAWTSAHLVFSDARTSPGTLAAAAPWVRGDAISGQTFLPDAAGFGSDETDYRDAWQFAPSTAGSPTRITSNLP